MYVCNNKIYTFVQIIYDSKTYAIQIYNNKMYTCIINLYKRINFIIAYSCLQ